MSLASMADFRGANRQLVQGIIRGPNSTTNMRWCASGPSAGSTPSVGNTTTGLVPTDANSQALGTITDFTGYAFLAGVEIEPASIANSHRRIMLYDRLFEIGACAAGNTYTLSSQPSYSGKTIGSDYSGLQIWAEGVTSVGGGNTITVTYTDQSGNAGHTTGAVDPMAGSGLSLSYAAQLPLAAGDCGVQKIESVVMSAGAGSANIYVIRPLATIEVAAGWALGCQPVTRRFLSTIGCRPVWSDSCLRAMFYDSSAGSFESYTVRVDLASN